MLRAMRSAASGMRAQQLYLDTVAHNLANVNTVGFKANRVGFEDLLYQTMTPVSAPSGEGAARPTAIQVGHGSRPTDTSKLFSQGDTEVTGAPLDLVIQGDGFFQVQLLDGTTGYTRDGSFHVDGAGRLVTSQGNVVQPEIVFPADASSVAIQPDGRVLIEQAGQNTQSEVGQILLARFVNPAGLVAEGGNTYRDTGGAGDPQLAAPGDAGIGQVIQGALERSNVEVVEEMVNMILAQRAFEVSSKAIKAADDMMGVAASIRPA
ncbi:MAG: flagellar basal-body rod protein FlgG [Candidatus Eisenbacteria bacterium]|nr:flagellar basal-body rod protein FlgG [Candidatus Eisenbacteria bacterium]MCC7144084.1 flagellar basal-body rod protein FlgG [Candidatus Eisenbacteria bacterium]